MLGGPTPVELLEFRSDGHRADLGVDVRGWDDPYCGEGRREGGFAARWEER